MSFLEYFFICNILALLEARSLFPTTIRKQFSYCSEAHGGPECFKHRYRCRQTLNGETSQHVRSEHSAVQLNIMTLHSTYKCLHSILLITKRVREAWRVLPVLTRVGNELQICIISSNNAAAPRCAALEFSPQCDRSHPT